MGKYVVRNGDLEGRKFRLEAGANITLGRERADLNFFDKRMSRRHCSLEVRDNDDFVIDLGSTNGTWLNNQRVKEAALQPGDLIRIGFTELEFLGNPEPAPRMLLDAPSGPALNPNQTIAFRAKDIMAPAPVKGRKRAGAKERLKEAKFAAMGKPTGGRQYISAKGKFCEACGEAIFVKEGAPDEGKMVDGLYLCRMCALISAKQRELGQDGLLPSYAKVVGGRMSGAAGGPSAEAIDAGESDAPMEIIEEEIDLDDLTGPDGGEDTVKAGEGPEAPPEITEEKLKLDDLPPPPDTKDEAEAAPEITEEEVGLDDLPAPPDTKDKAEAAPETAEEEVGLDDLPAPPDTKDKAEAAPETAEEEVGLDDLPAPPGTEDEPAAPPEITEEPADLDALPEPGKGRGPTGDEGAVAEDPAGTPADDVRAPEEREASSDRMAPSDAFDLLDELLATADAAPSDDSAPPPDPAPDSIALPDELRFEGEPGGSGGAKGTGRDAGGKKADEKGRETEEGPDGKA